MSKRLKVMVSVLVAVLLLTVGGVATVLADDGTTPTPDTTSTNGLLARVAEKLGVAEEELGNAFREARQEMRDEACLGALDKAVAEGYISQEEADEVRGWWGQKPEALDQGLLRHSFSFRSMRKNMAGNHGGWQRIGPPVSAD